MISQLIVRGKISRRVFNEEKNAYVSETKKIEHRIFIDSADLMVLGIEPNIEKSGNYPLDEFQTQAFLENHTLKSTLLHFNEEVKDPSDITITIYPAQHIYCTKRYIENDGKSSKGKDEKKQSSNRTSSEASDSDYDTAG